MSYKLMVRYTGNTMILKADSNTKKPLLWFVTITLLITAGLYFDVQHLLKDILDWIDTLNQAAPLVFVLIYVIACVLFIPGSVLTLGAGLVFGVIWGTVLVSLASTIGASCAFLIGRYFARDYIANKLLGNKKFASIDDAVGKEGWKIVFLTRLSPVFPFNLLNYAFGLTKVNFKDYLLASWVGMMPGTVMYVYIGSLAGSLATLTAVGTQEHARSGTEWAMFVVGLIATITVTVYVTRVAKKALDKRVA